MIKNVKLFKIFLLITVILLLITGAVGCKTTAAAETETTAAAKTETTAAAETETTAGLTGTINAMGWKWAPSDEMERAMAKFTEDTGIKVNLELMDYANYYQTLTTRLNGSDIDIAFAHAAFYFSIC